MKKKNEVSSLIGRAPNKHTIFVINFYLVLNGVFIIGYILLNNLPFQFMTISIDVHCC